MRGELDRIDYVDAHFDERLYDHVILLEHVALGVGVYTAALAPGGPDCGLSEANTEPDEVGADLVVGFLDAEFCFLARWGEEDVHESDKVFR